MKILFAILALVIGAAVAAALAGAFSWKRATQAEVATLSPPAAAPEAFDPTQLDGLPAPVARYLRKAITNGHPIVRSAIAIQEAQFFINGAWHALHATQHFSTSPPGFVWDARIEMAPLMPAYVRDEYVNGRAKMQASMYGIYPLANQLDKPQLNAGALQRFLGEAVWFPTALLPSSTLTWTARDDRSATVTLTDGAAAVALLFAFNDADMPVVISGDRYKEDDGQYAVQKWQIMCDEAVIHDGLTMPAHCEVAWIINGTRQPYWRGRITSINYQYDGME
jgi:hypothetical protein